MTTVPPADEDPRPQDAPVKAVWTRPTMDVLDVEAATKAGGFMLADQDPNMNS